VAAKSQSGWHRRFQRFQVSATLCSAVQCSAVQSSTAQCTPVEREGAGEILVASSSSWFTVLFLAILVPSLPLCLVLISNNFPYWYCASQNLLQLLHLLKQTKFCKTDAPGLGIAASIHINVWFNFLEVGGTSVWGCVQKRLLIS
jgi:hypothetical protein